MTGRGRWCGLSSGQCPGGARRSNSASRASRGPAGAPASFEAELNPRRTPLLTQSGHRAQPSENPPRGDS
jgi:hypothetical protein